MRSDSRPATHGVRDAPAPEDPFLVIDRGSARPAAVIMYGDLWKIAGRWSESIPESGSIGAPLLLIPSGRAVDVMAMACLRVLRIPFLTIDPESSKRDVDRVRDLFGDIRPAPVDALSTLLSSDGFDGWDPPAPSNSSASTSSAPSSSHIPSAAAPEASDAAIAWFFTSGSEGAPKCVPVSERQVIESAHATAPLFRPDPGRAWLLTLPLHHVGGASIVLRSLRWGSSILVPEDRSLEAVRRLLSSESRIQVVSMVARQLGRWLREQEPFDRSAWPPNLDAVLLGGGPVPDWIAARCREHGLPVYSGYGMTETFGMLLCRDLRTTGAATSVGHPPPSLELRVDRGGELHIRTPQLFGGYLGASSGDTQADGMRRPGGRLDRSRFDGEGWFRTGDLARLERGRTLHILARRSDLILSGGENISPIVVETAFQECRWISAAGVAGVEDPEWGQKVVALVERTPDAAAEDRHLESDPISKSRIWGQLKRHERPKSIHYVERLPRTSLGKLNRGALREMAQRLEAAASNRSDDQSSG